MDTYEATVRTADGERQLHWFQAIDANAAWGVAQIKAGHEGDVVHVGRVRTIQYTR